jgi:hypothetical protein
MHILKLVKNAALAAFVFLWFVFLWTFVSLARLPRDTAIGISALYSPAFWILAAVVTAAAVGLCMGR